MPRAPARSSLLVLAAAALLTGCSEDGGSSGGSGGATGSLAVRLTDAPIDMSNVQSVNVTIAGVAVYPGEPLEPLGASAGPIDLLSHPATFDLLTLTGGATQLLASGEVTAGEYDRIRLEITDATLVFTDATSVPLTIESNKVDVPIDFTVTAGEATTLTLDFDAAASVHVTGTGSDKSILRPVVTPAH